MFNVQCSVFRYIMFNVPVHAHATFPIVYHCFASSSFLSQVILLNFSATLSINRFVQPFPDVCLSALPHVSRGILRINVIKRSNRIKHTIDLTIAVTAVQMQIHILSRNKYNYKYQYKHTIQVHDPCCNLRAVHCCLPTSPL